MAYQPQIHFCADCPHSFGADACFLSHVGLYSPPQNSLTAVWVICFMNLKRFGTEPNVWRIRKIRKVYILLKVIVLLHKVIVWKAT